MTMDHAKLMAGRAAVTQVEEELFAVTFPFWVAGRVREGLIPLEPESATAVETLLATEDGQLAISKWLDSNDFSHIERHAKAACEGEDFEILFLELAVSMRDGCLLIEHEEFSTVWEPITSTWIGPRSGRT